MKILQFFWINTSSALKRRMHLSNMRTQFILNYKTIDFFNIKFNYSFYLKIWIKYYFFYCGLVYL
jgi:hypothetical protein